MTCKSLHGSDKKNFNFKGHERFFCKLRFCTKNASFPLTSTVDIIIIYYIVEYIVFSHYEYTSKRCYFESVF